MLAPTRLDTRLLIRRDHTVPIRQGGFLPETFIEIEDAPGLLAEQGIPWKYPAAMAPGPDSILAEPAPDRRFPNRSDQPAIYGCSFQIGHAEP